MKSLSVALLALITCISGCSSSPIAVAEMLTEEKDFPAYEWIDKVPRKYEDCSSGYCIKLKLDQKCLINYLKNEYRPRIGVRVKYYDSKNRFIGRGYGELSSLTKVNKIGKVITPKTLYIYPTANRSVYDEIDRPIKFSKVIIEYITTSFRPLNCSPAPNR